MGLIRISTYAVCRLAIAYFVFNSASFNTRFLLYSVENCFAQIYKTYCRANTFLSIRSFFIPCLPNLSLRTVPVVSSLSALLSSATRLPYQVVKLHGGLCFLQGIPPSVSLLHVSLSLVLDRLPILSLMEAFTFQQVKAEVTVKCGTPQHYEIFSLYLRINHA